MKRVTLSLVCGVLVGFVASSQAAVIGLWDAAAPGADPANTWADHSSSGYDLGLEVGDAGAGPVHNAAGYYDMDLGNGFVGNGSASETIFDFETDVAGAGLGTPFSIHVYKHRTGFLGGGQTGENMVGKTTNHPGAGGQFAGWLWGGNGDNAQRFDFSMQVGNNSERLYHRVQDDAGHAAGINDVDVLLTVTHDGTGTHAGTQQYVNGVAAAQPWQLDTLTLNAEGSSVLSDEHLRIGWQPWGGNSANSGTDSNLYFVEIHDTALSAEDVLARWNGGSPVRVPEPASLALLALGGGLLWWRRRS